MSRESRPLAVNRGVPRDGQFFRVAPVSCKESTDTANGAQREAVREMLTFVERNRVRLEGVTVRELIHEGHRVSDFVLDASLALQWFLEDEENRKYSLAVLVSLSEKRALDPCCGSMKLATASSWPAGASESPSIRLTVS
jgi:hypothetical protein